MDFVSQILMTFVIFTSSLFGLGDVAVQTDFQNTSVELGLTEVSPAGPEGGFAVPASGCSDLSHGPIHDCDTPPTIDVTPKIIRSGETANVTWNPETHQNCVLGGNMPSTGTIALVAGSEDVSPSADTLYTIICDGVGNEASSYLRVLPVVQQT